LTVGNLADPGQPPPDAIGVRRSLSDAAVTLVANNTIGELGTDGGNSHPGGCHSLEHQLCGRADPRHRDLLNAASIHTSDFLFA
jgi:hypothetical protein